MMFALWPCADTQQGSLFRLPEMPWWVVARQAALHAPMSHLNNVAFAFGRVNQVLHVVVRSAGGLASMLLGWGFYEKVYSVAQLLCVVAATGGAVLIAVAERMVHNGVAATTAECGHAGACSRIETGAVSAEQASERIGANHWATTAAAGELVLVVVLFMAAWLTHMQSADRRRFPRVSMGESMLWTHLLGLGFLLLLGADAAPAWLRGGEEGYMEKAARWTQSRPTAVFVAEMLQGYMPVTEVQVAAALGPWASAVPHLFALTLLNGLTQVLCVGGVYVMLDAGEPVSITLVMTARKAITWGLSVLLFGHNTVWLHFVAAAIVFSGVAAYSLVPGPKAPATAPSQASEPEQQSSRHRGEATGIAAADTKAMKDSSRTLRRRKNAQALARE